MSWEVPSDLRKIIHQARRCRRLSTLCFLTPFSYRKGEDLEIKSFDLNYKFWGLFHKLYPETERIPDLEYSFEKEAVIVNERFIED